MDFDDGDLSSIFVFSVVTFPCTVALPVKTTSLKSARGTQLGLWLVVSQEAPSPPTTPLSLVTSCGLGLSRMHRLAELGSEQPSHTVSVSTKTLAHCTAGGSLNHQLLLHQS